MHIYATVYQCLNVIPAYLIIFSFFSACQHFAFPLYFQYLSSPTQLLTLPFFHALKILSKETLYTYMNIFICT